MNANNNTAPVINYMPILFAAPAASKASATLAEKAAVQEVSRAITAAYYAGIIGGAS